MLNKLSQDEKKGAVRSGVYPLIFVIEQQARSNH